MADRRFELVAVGHIVHETIYFPDKTIGPVLGSPPAYSLVTAAKQGIRCGLVTKIGADFPQQLLIPFKEAGVDTKGIINCGTSTCSELIYDSHGNKEIKFPSRAESINACDIPESYRNCRLIYVCTMEDDVPLEQLQEVALIGEQSAVDLGGYGGVHMSKQRRSQIKDISAFALEAGSYFDFVKASDEDCRYIFGQADVSDYGRKLLSGRTIASLITMGSKGALVTTSDGSWHVPPLDGRPVDATGGGDSFMGGFLSEYLRCGDILQSAVYGSATALCVIEKSGGVLPERMPTEQQVRARIPANIMEKIILQ